MNKLTYNKGCSKARWDSLQAKGKVFLICDSSQTFQCQDMLVQSLTSMFRDRERQYKYCDRLAVMVKKGSNSVKFSNEHIPVTSFSYLMKKIITI